MASPRKSPTEKALTILDLPKDEAANVLTILLTDHLQTERDLQAKLKATLKQNEAIKKELEVERQAQRQKAVLMAGNVREMKDKMQETLDAVEYMRDYIDEFADDFAASEGLDLDRHSS